MVAKLGDGGVAEIGRSGVVDLLWKGV